MIAVAAGDNLDLQVRRKRLGLTQRELIRALGGGIAVSAVSDFENGHRDDLPGGLTRADYERALEDFEEQVTYIAKENGQ